MEIWSMQLELLHKEIQKCSKCDWLCTHRQQVVCGKGPINSSVMLLGESPGQDESILGEPFVGRCGDLLNKMLENAKIDRKLLYVTNTTKCRPTKDNRGKSNRPPTDDEINNCKPWLWSEIKLIKPKLIITLGRIPANTLLKLKTSVSLGSIIGKKHDVVWNDVSTTIIPTWHPSYLMVHRADLVKQTVEHLKLIKEYL